MNVTTRIVLNVPIFIGALAGIAGFTSGGILLTWGLFIVAAVIQSHLFNRKT